MTVPGPRWSTSLDGRIHEAARRPRRHELDQHRDLLPAAQRRRRRAARRPPLRAARWCTASTSTRSPPSSTRATGTRTGGDPGRRRRAASRRPAPRGSCSRRTRCTRSPTRSRSASGLPLLHIADATAAAVTAAGLTPGGAARHGVHDGGHVLRRPARAARRRGGRAGPGRPGRGAPDHLRRAGARRRTRRSRGSATGG